MYFLIGMVMILVALFGCKIFDPQPTFSWRDDYIWAPLLAIGSILVFCSWVVFCWQHLP